MTAVKAADMAADHWSFVGPEGEPLESLCERGQGSGGAGNKPPVKIQQAEKLLELLERLSRTRFILIP